MRRALLAVSLLCGLLVGGSRPVAAACTLQFRDGLQHVRSEIDTGPAPAAADALQQLAAGAGGADALQSVLDDLRAAPPRLDDARSRLDAAIHVLEEPSGAVCGADTSAAGAALHDVYRSPVFADLDRWPAQQPASSQPAKVSWPVAALVALVVGLLIAALVAFVVWRLRGIAVPVEASTRRVEPPGSGTDPDVEWRLAAEAAAAGDHREAVRRAFRGALLDVAVAGRMSVSASATTRELLAQARGDADLVAALAPAADSFDRAWYSGEPVTAADWEQARGRCEAVRRLARMRREVPA